MVMRPFNESLYLAHFLPISCTFLKHFSQLSFRSLSLLSIWNPSKVNLSSQLSVNSGQSLSLVLQLPPIGITAVFSKLQWSPLILAKCFKNSIHLLRQFGSLLIKIEVSSANVSLLDSFWAQLIPCISFVLLIYSNLPLLYLLYSAFA